VQAKQVAYWATTALIAAELVAGGVTDLAHGREVLVAGQPVVDVLQQLGYPAYLLAILGVWKLLAAAAILAPGLPRLKEWAYAGAFFELSGAALSHMVVEHNFGNAGGPLFLAALALASWVLRPQSRVLGVILPWRSRKLDEAREGHPNKL
jgi:uncharacterized membrane protein YphA (DoxX/SURF4 family)